MKEPDLSKGNISVVDDECLADRELWERRGRSWPLLCAGRYVWLFLTLRVGRDL